MERRGARRRRGIQGALRGVPDRAQNSIRKEKTMMRKMLVLTAAFSTLALAENYSGKLLDATCYDQQKKASGCDATSQSVSFALDVSGKVYKLDAAGNSQAASAIRNRADRADPNKPQSKEVMAKVTGNEKGGTITVESIEVQ
jgi:hypothetical protein